MIAPSHRQHTAEVLDNFIPWLVEGIATSRDAPAKAFALVRSLIELDDEELAAGRCRPGRNRAAWGSLFDDAFAPHQAAITAAVLHSGTFAEACARTAALVLPDVTVPPSMLARWANPAWRWL